MHIRAHETKQWEEQHAQHGVSEALVARSVKQEKTLALAKPLFSREGM